MRRRSAWSSLFSRPAMPWRIALPVLMIGLLLMSARPGAAEHAASLLRLGEILPRFSGQTLAGKPLELPAAGAGSQAVVVFTFSREAGSDARLWSEHLARASSAAVPTYTVIFLEAVPWPFRGLALSSIKGGVPRAMQERTAVAYRDEDLWEQRLRVSDQSRAYLVLLGPDGTIRWRNSGAFADADFARLLNELAPPPHAPSRR